MGPPALTGGWRRWHLRHLDPRRRSFNGAAGSHRRMAKGEQHDRPRAWSFNGAAGSHRRMATGQSYPQTGTLYASMGPPALTGGWPRPTRQATHPHASFNGAAGSHRRMAHSKHPRSGNRLRLQWGRRLSPADGPQRPPVPGLRPRLQWGRRLSPADGPLPGPIRACHSAASMGPPALTGGWKESTPTPCAKSSSFNGAAGSHRRMAKEPQPHLRARALASMGPPALTGGWE